MGENLLNFIGDLITLIQERYNLTIDEPLNESETDKAFRLGSNLAHYSDLDLIESQLSAYGIESKSFGVITPVLGERLVREK